MSKAKFTFGSIPLLDGGKIVLAFDKEVERAVADCMDRPADKRPRSVQVTFKMIPTSTEESKGDCDQVVIAAEITSTIPKRRTRPYVMVPHTNNQLSFNPDLPDDPNSATLFDDREEQ